MAEKNIYFHQRTNEIQCPSGGFDYLSLSPGDTFYVTNSKRNDGVYTVVSSNDSQIFVKERLNDELKTEAILSKPVVLKPLEVKKPPPPTPKIPTEPFLPEPTPTALPGVPPVLIFPQPPLPPYWPETPITPEEPEIKPKPKIVPTKPEPKKPTIPKETVIQRIDFPKWWKNLMTQEINLSTTGTQVVVDGWPGFRTFISQIVLTVNGETTITFGFGVWGSSGPMHFGGEGQPMGIVISMGAAPAPCGAGGFSVTSSGEDVIVGGFIVYSHEKW